MGAEEVIESGGLTLCLEQSQFGPRIPFVYDEGPHNWLAWVLNEALQGGVPGFVAAVERRELTGNRAVTARPADADDDLAKAAIAWRELTGGELGDDVYAVSVTWTGKALFMPRAVLLDLVRRLEAMRAAAEKPPAPWLFLLNVINHEPHPDEQGWLVELEARAAEFDKLTRGASDLDPSVAARRRLLLFELEEYGLLTFHAGEHRATWLERWRLPTLLGYQQATLAIRRYWDTLARLNRIDSPPSVPTLLSVRSVLGAAVSVDWFRGAVPTPSGWDADDWLAFCERSLQDAGLGEHYSGELFIHQGGFRGVIAWRRDDGVHPSVVSARLR